MGYPTFEDSLEAFRIVLREGTDILEIGFPFSDPVADGPTIQRAHQVALENGTKAEDVFNLSRTLRQEFEGIPFLLMTYYNPIFKMGLERFVKLAKDSGIDGFIVPDLPPEECLDLKRVCERKVCPLFFWHLPQASKKAQAHMRAYRPYYILCFPDGNHWREGCPSFGETKRALSPVQEGMRKACGGGLWHLKGRAS